MMNDELGGNVQGDEVETGSEVVKSVKAGLKDESGEKGPDELTLLKSTLDYIFAKADMGFRNVSESKAKNTFLEIRKAAAGALKK